LFSNIVVPVDGSDPSFRALNVALSFSKALGSKISVIHAMEIVPTTHMQSQKLLDKLEAYKKEAQDTIIIGSRVMGKFKELILGSVSSKIVHHSLCSVMLVK
jgi:nucleotide-binding universal stress UspA family protein